jgi:hypothetical protein
MSLKARAQWVQNLFSSLDKAAEFFPGCFPTRVYLASDIDAIPKLELSDLEMAQLCSLLGVATHVRNMQIHPDAEELEFFLHPDVVFATAQRTAAINLYSKIADYLEAHEIPPALWPTTENPYP